MDEEEEILENIGWLVTCPECNKDIPLEEYQYGHDCE